MEFAREQINSFRSADPNMIAGMNQGYGSYGDPGEVTLRALESLFTRRDVYDLAEGKAFARQFIATVFMNRDVDLVTLLVSSTAGRIAFEQICLLIGPHTSPFKAMCADRQTFFEFFTALCEHLKGIDVDFQRAEGSVALELITEYTLYFFPEDDKVLNNHPSINTLYVGQAHPSRSQMFDSTYHDESQLGTPSPIYENDVTLQSAAYVNYFQCMVMSLTSMRRWPTSLQIIVLRFVIKEFYKFILTPPSSSFDQRNRARVLNDPPMVDEVQDFCESLFERWPLDETFRSVMDVWITFTRPWRYSAAYAQGIEITEYTHFIAQSRGALLYPCQALIKRFQDADLCRLHTAASLTLLAEVLTKPWMNEVFTILDYNVDNILDVLKKTAGSGIGSIKRREAYLEMKCEAMGWKKFLFDDTALERQRLKEAASYYYKLIPTNEPIPLPSDFDDSQMFSEKEDIAEPDHRINPATGIKTLTALGQQQVLRRRKQFNFSKAVKSMPRILSPPAWYESPTAVHLALRLSENLQTLSYTQKLAAAYGQWTLLGLLAFILMEPPFPRGGVPAFTCNIERRDASPNIRFMASYPFILLCLYFLLRLLLLILF